MILKSCLLLIVALAVDELLAIQGNTTSNALINATGKTVDGRRRFRAFDGDDKESSRKPGYRSTSSSSGSNEKASKAGSARASTEPSMEMTDISSSEKEGKKKEKKGQKKYERKSSAERKGWKKWHRKCHPCPEEMAMKWRDPRVKWICGAYQRARRSFKSLCMMHYRNCQDGTMFVKIHDHRCQDDNERADSVKHGDHMFYTYNVVISGEDGGSSDATKSKSASTDSNLYGSDYSY